MGSRGRKSADAMAAGALAVLETRRPAPPRNLSEAEGAVWRDTVACMPAGWFTRSQYPILIAYCRHTVRSETMAAHICAFRSEWLKDDGGLARLDKLMAMAERETRALTACARSMRLTHQAQILPRTAGTAARQYTGPRPWDDNFGVIS